MSGRSICTSFDQSGLKINIHCNTDTDTDDETGILDEENPNRNYGIYHFAFIFDLANCRREDCTYLVCM